MATTHAETVTESHILTSYLLPPSPLPTVLPYSDFVKTCVPAQHRAHPYLKRLYTNLQFQRNIDIDSVRQNIEREAYSKAPGLRARLTRAVADENNGVKHKPNASRKRKRGSHGVVVDVDLELKDESSSGDEFTNPVAAAVDLAYEASSVHPAEKATAGPGQRRATSNVVGGVRNPMHTTASLLDSMDSAATALERDIAELEQQADTMLSQMQETVGGLSDLRYGKFARATDSDGKTMEQGIVDALQELQTACARVRDKQRQTDGQG